MKKSKYGLIGALLIMAMMLGITPTVRGTTYTGTGAVGAQAIWRVKTVNPDALTDIFGASPYWEGNITYSFGLGADQLGARMKTVVTSVNASEMMWTPIGTSEFHIIYADVWWWTTSPFANVSDASNVDTWIWLHPENLTLYCQAMTGFTRNVSQVVAFPFLNGLPIPAGTYLSELVWDNDYSISGTTVTHNVAAGYFVVGPIGPPIGPFLDNCTQTWRYSSSYGTFLGYKLVHEDGTVAYETVLEVGAAAIPGFEITIIVGVSLGMIASVIYVVMKKKK